MRIVSSLEIIFLKNKTQFPTKTAQQLIHKTTQQLILKVSVTNTEFYRSDRTHVGYKTVYVCTYLNGVTIMLPIHTLIFIRH